MALFKYSESAVQSRELLKRAIAFIGAHQLAANPVNYTVCYEYLLGTHPVLKEEIDHALVEHKVLTDQMMERWFKAFLSEYDLVALQQSQSDLIEVVSVLNESAKLAEENVNEFGDVLRRSEKQLVDPNISMESVVAHLMASTEAIQASMELMRQKIQESRQEIDALRGRLEKISEEAMTDALTGLVNRKGLTEAIENALQAATKPSLFPCIMMADIDNFKAINDTFGHLVGDQVIKRVADTLKKQVKGKDTAARYGGEEFCVLLPETELSHAAKLAENIRDIMEKTRVKRSKDQQEIGPVTLSIGVARYFPKETIIEFIQRADTALYQSKNDGRNKVTCAK